MVGLRHVVLLSIAGLMLAVHSPAAADVYRWVDDQGGEHFTMDLHRVPAKHRGEARRRKILDEAQAEPSPPPINTMTPADDARTRRALRPSYSRRAHRAPAASSSGCASWQRDKAAKLERKIALYEQKVDLYEEKERRLVRLEDRIQAENAAERYEIYLEQAEEEYESFLSDMRQRGVPPGCLR